MRASVTEARVTVYVCVHMPRECVCERKDVHAYCSKMLAAQQKQDYALAELWGGGGTLPPCSKELEAGAVTVLEESSASSVPARSIVFARFAANANASMMLGVPAGALLLDMVRYSRRTTHWHFAFGPQLLFTSFTYCTLLSRVCIELV